MCPELHKTSGFRSTVAIGRRSAWRITDPRGRLDERHAPQLDAAVHYFRDNVLLAWSPVSVRSVMLMHNRMLPRAAGSGRVIGDQGGAELQRIGADDPADLKNTADSADVEPRQRASRSAGRRPVGRCSIG